MTSVERLAECVRDLHSEGWTSDAVREALMAEVEAAIKLAEDAPRLRLPDEFGGAIRPIENGGRIEFEAVKRRKRSEVKG